MTRFELIKRYDLESFAVLLDDVRNNFRFNPCDYCAWKHYSIECNNSTCVEAIKDWLNEEVFKL